MSPDGLEGLSASLLLQMDCFKLSLILDLSADVGHLYRSVHRLRPFDQVSGRICVRQLGLPQCISSLPSLAAPII